MENRSTTITLKKPEIFFIGFSLLISITVIFAWFFEFKSVLSIIPGSPTMKFNTAVVFFIVSFNLIITYKENKIISALYNFLSFISIIIGVLTLLEYHGISLLNIDNLIIEDFYVGLDFF